MLDLNNLNRAVTVYVCSYARVIRQKQSYTVNARGLSALPVLSDGSAKMNRKTQSVIEDSGAQNTPCPCQSD